jgi:hypothetical protein
MGYPNDRSLSPRSTEDEIVLGFAIVPSFLEGGLPVICRQLGRKSRAIGRSRRLLAKERPYMFILNIHEGAI